MILASVEMDYIKFLNGPRYNLKLILKKHLKAYTLFDFKVDELDQTFECKKSIMKNKIRINGKKVWSGSYTFIPDENEKNVKITIHLD